jgi:DNA polymerase-4
VLERKLKALGITQIAHLQALGDRDARARLGDDGPALVRRARGEDVRMVHVDSNTKSISAETTFDTDLSDLPGLERRLWQMAEKLGRRLREQELAAGGVVLKLKTAQFASRTRNVRLPGPTQLPEVLFRAGQALLAREADGTAFRLIGIGAQPLLSGLDADRGDLADPDARRRQARWQAVEAVRAKFGQGAVVAGRSLPTKR